jgi:hypothetical protein
LSSSVEVTAIAALLILMLAAILLLPRP